VIVVTHRLSAIGRLVDEVVAFRQGREASQAGANPNGLTDSLYA
jgi:ABC-type uncharacterized transport system ATPase subunit